MQISVCCAVVIWEGQGLLRSTYYLCVRTECSFVRLLYYKTFQGISGCDFDKTGIEINFSAFKIGFCLIAALSYVFGLSLRIYLILEAKSNFN